MLKSLSIKNYALIDSLIIDFSGDLNILTGETGAGKSILLGALGLIIGQRADSSVLRDKTEKCSVEGIFDIRNYGMQSFFSENELDYDDVTILRREITPQGKSRAFINDTPVNVKILYDLGIKLIDIHSQHQNLDLNEKNYQLRVVDLVAGNGEILKVYNTEYKTYLALQDNLDKSLILAEQSKKDLDYFEFQFQQLDDAKLLPDEQLELELLLEKLTHAEEIRSVFGMAYQALSEDERSVLSVLKENLTSIGKLKSVLPEAEQIFNRMESVYLELKDLASESLVIEERTENNPEKIVLVNQRLDLIYSLQQKHRVSTVAELLQIQAEFEAKIHLVSSYDQDIEEYRKKIVAQKEILTELAGKILLKRKAVGPQIESKVIDILRNVGIPNAALQLKFTHLSEFSPSGLDEVSYLFSANKNQELQEIGKIASGGEMSRLMLAIKTLITDARSLPTIVFDEIDTGVSGEVAVKMGQILEQMSKTVQVLNITHLPQIAAKGNNHFKVYKFDLNNQTFTSIKKLSDQERVEEIAQMLSGENYSNTAMETAKELLR
ncbi:DNA repair protein RecN [Aquipluma nitroreducens]|uniref:DNA repair protein RecN n=1 Tax=Aquipluma nitroreducens TaxID=2010828 RepID=A0A5K7SH69_9BACT|nr:DNA repair protein RecN [Aquipluma nitroreducens]BBE20845.1 DNA repair protein RecN [Aquipluma nitroreducens]